MAIAVREDIGPPTVPASQPALRARDIVKRFRSSGKDVRAVDGVSLSVARGEIYALLGANGSGKSTLIRCFSTLLEADAGAVTVFGLDIREDELAVKRLINRVSVEASFFKKLSAMENLVYAGRLYGVPAPDARARSREILVRLGIAVARHDEPLEKLSRGMQQKVAIARAFLTSRLADRVGVLHGGRLVAEGTPSELIERHSARGSLEDVFMTITGRKIEEAEKDEKGEADRS